MEKWDFYLSLFSTTITACATVLIYFATKEASKAAKQSVKSVQETAKISERMEDISFRLAKFQSETNSMNIVNSANAIALSSDENMHAATRLLHDDILNKICEDDKEKERDLWLTFMFLNGLQVKFFANEGGMIQEDYVEVANTKILKKMLHNSLVRYVVEHRGYSPKFLKHCKNLYSGDWYEGFRNLADESSSNIQELV